MKTSTIYDLRFTKWLAVFLTLALGHLSLFANLIVTVQPGYSFGPDEVPTTDHLNLLGQPVIAVTGTLDGSTSLAAGTVTGILLADSVPDGVTVGFNASVPRQLQVLGAGIAGPGMTNFGVNEVTPFTDVSLTNANNTLAVSQPWVFNAIWKPWQVFLTATNTYTNAFWGYTNIVPVTNIVIGGFPQRTLTSTDTVPVIANQQQASNTVATLGAISQFADSTHLKQVSTIAFGGNAFSNDVITSITLLDSSGTFTVMSTANTFHLTNAAPPLTNVVQRIADSINASTVTPPFTAAVSQGTNILLFEPLIFYPYSGATVTVNFSTTSNLTAKATSFNTPPLYANPLPTAQTFQMAGGSQSCTSTNITQLVSGGVPPYTFAWSFAVLANNGISGAGTVGLSSTTANPVNLSGTLQPSGGTGSFLSNSVSCTVSDKSGQQFYSTAYVLFIR